MWGDRMGELNTVVLLNQGRPHDSEIGEPEIGITISLTPILQY